MAPTSTRNPVRRVMSTTCVSEVPCRVTAHGICSMQQRHFRQWLPFRKRLLQVGLLQGVGSCMCGFICMTRLAWLAMNPGSASMTRIEKPRASRSSSCAFTHEHATSWAFRMVYCAHHAADETSTRRPPRLLLTSKPPVRRQI